MVTSPLESTMVQQAGISATPSYQRLGANSLPGLLPWSSSGECLEPQQPQPLWPRCNGERKVSHMFPYAQVLREIEWKGEKRERRTDTHTLALSNAFLPQKHLYHHPPQLNCQESFLWRQGGTGAMTPSHTEGVLRGCSAKDPSCHPPTLMCYILTSSVKVFFGLP